MYSDLKVVHQLFLEEQLLDKDVKILDSQVHQHHDIATFDLKSKRAQYKNNQRNREDKKNNRNRENRKGKKSRKGYQRNKLDSVIEESDGLKASDYYYRIYGTSKD